MATRYSKLISAQGNKSQFTANSRLWTVERSGGERMLAELHRGKDGGLSFFPGLWDGQPRQGFGALEGAGYWRRRALATRDPQDRVLFKRRAIDAVSASREMRVTHELMIERRRMIEEAESYVAVGRRAA